MIYFKNMADRSQLQKFLRAQSELCWRCFQELKKQILEDLKPELQASIWVEVEPVIFLVVFSWPPPAIIFMAMPPVMVGLWQAFPGFPRFFFGSGSFKRANDDPGDVQLKSVVGALDSQPYGSYLALFLTAGFLCHGCHGDPIYLPYFRHLFASNQPKLHGRFGSPFCDCDGEQCWTERSVVNKWPCTSHWLNTLIMYIQVYIYT